MEEDSHDKLLKKVFPSEIQFRRVKKEFQMLSSLDSNIYKVSSESGPLGLKIIVEVVLDALDLGEQIHFENLNFEIVLEPKFPFVFPMFFLKNDVCSFV